VKERIIVALDTDSPESPSPPSGPLSGRSGCSSGDGALPARWSGPGPAHPRGRVRRLPRPEVSRHTEHRRRGRAVRRRDGVRFTTVHASGAGDARRGGRGGPGDRDDDPRRDGPHEPRRRGPRIRWFFPGRRGGGPAASGPCFTSGVAGSSAPRKEVAAVRARVGKEVALVTPGVRMAGRTRGTRSGS